MSGSRISRLLIAMTLFFFTAAVILVFFLFSRLQKETDTPSRMETASAALPFHEELPETIPAVTFDTVPKPEPDAVYTVWLYDQELRLTTAAAPDTYTVLHSIDPRTLRDSDRSALEQGVSLDSETALVSFLEDFSS